MVCFQSLHGQRMEPFPEPKPVPLPDASVCFLPEHGQVPPGHEVWLFEGTLERFTGEERTFRVRQRAAWPHRPCWEQVRAVGQWMVERLSINGHLLLGLRARREDEPASAARLVG